MILLKLGYSISSDITPYLFQPFSEWIPSWFSPGTALKFLSVPHPQEGSLTGLIQKKMQQLEQKIENWSLWQCSFQLPREFSQAECLMFTKGINVW